MKATLADAKVTRRDPRIDFFRGIALMVIFAAHMPFNAWSVVMPTRFGFSDGADIFVFCSGLASGIAYGGVFVCSGYLAGSARVALRAWQVYWAHICVFVFAAAILIAADEIFERPGTYVELLNLHRFFDGDVRANLLGLVTLTYVPNLFDILPLYVVVLTLIPLVMALSRFGAMVPIVVSIALWLAATNGYLKLPAEPWSARTWHFHPFAWQLLFFAGFAISRGWLSVPTLDRRAVSCAIAFVVLCAPIAYWPLAEKVPTLKYLHVSLAPWTDKSSYGALRIIHFASAAYVAYWLCGPMGENLKGRVVDVVSTVGRHSLGVFLTGIILSLVGGILLNEFGDYVLAFPVVNLGGLALLIAAAYGIGWMKSKPWTRNERSVSTAMPETEMGITIEPKSRSVS